MFESVDTRPGGHTDGRRLESHLTSSSQRFKVLARPNMFSTSVVLNGKTVQENDSMRHSFHSSFTFCENALGVHRP